MDQVSGLMWRTHELVFTAGHVGDVHVVGGRAEIFKLLARENVDGNKMNLGVTVLSSLGGGHFNDLARTVLDDNKAVLPQSRALHGEGGGSASIGALEGMLLMLFDHRQLLYPSYPRLRVECLCCRSNR